LCGGDRRRSPDPQRQGHGVPDRRPAARHRREPRSHEPADRRWWDRAVLARGGQPRHDHVAARRERPPRDLAARDRPALRGAARVFDDLPARPTMTRSKAPARATRQRRGWVALLVLAAGCAPGAMSVYAPNAGTRTVPPLTAPIQLYLGRKTNDSVELTGD